MCCPERDPIPRIREILNRDREWSLYALGDLAPAESIHCEWRFTGATKIAANDLNELVELYNCRDGQEKEGTFFSPAQVVAGGYFGIREALLENKFDPAPDFIVTLLTFSPT